jgi:hypothetical protein
MIIELLGILMILGAGAAIGALLSVRHREHLRAEQQAEEDHLAEIQELYAAWAMIRGRPPGGDGPNSVDPRDRLLP